MTTSPPIPPSSLPPSIPKSLILGLSGVSSSGKTTIATHLLSIFSSFSSPSPSSSSSPPSSSSSSSSPSSSSSSSSASSSCALLSDVTLVHADDFYRPESSLPFRAGHRDWDCAAALDLPALCACLDAWLHRGEPVGARPRQGVLTSVLEGAPGQDEANPTVPDADNQNDHRLFALARRLRAETQQLQAAATPAITTGIPPTSLPRLLILDGFLLFPSPPLPALLPSLLHIKILLRANRAAALARRLARPGYVTLDGFWADPPGYFEDVVWSHYVESHARYFEGGDVEAELDAEVCRTEQVRVGPAGEGLEGVLEWVVGVVWEEMGIV